jgi:hypothetical protein
MERIAVFRTRKKMRAQKRPISQRFNFPTEEAALSSSAASIWGTLPHQLQGCQIFLGTAYQNVQNIPKMTKNVPHGHKIYEMAVHRPNGHKIYQPLSLQETPKFTQIGLYIYHLATLTIFQPRKPGRKRGSGFLRSKASEGLVGMNIPIVRPFRR